MAKRTTEELAQQLADMKWGDSLSDLEMGAYEARALGRAFVELRQQLGAVKPEQDDGWVEWHGGECPVAEGTFVDVRYRDGEVVNNLEALRFDRRPRDASYTFWELDGCNNDIVAYRIVS